MRLFERVSAARRRTAPVRRLAVTAALLVAAATAPAPAAAASPGLVRVATHAVTFDHYSLMIDGQRTFIWSGEFHYWRLPSPDAWVDVLQKMKATGYNAVTIYFDWGYHSPAPGVFDFTGVRDVDTLLGMAAQAGLYVIARPGPYINAETDDGGLPPWLSREPGTLRTSDPSYLSFALDWQRHIDAILARHQLTNGTGTVILYQVENELTHVTTATEAYMQTLERQARADGITVPLTHNDIGLHGHWASGPGAVDLYGFDIYPLGFNCASPATWRTGPPDLSNAHRVVPANEPLYFAEFQGGSFDRWGGAGFARCRTLTGPDFERVFSTSNFGFGVTLENSYMTFGGTSWGWLPSASVSYTSYDYGAALDEGRRLTDKITTQKELGYFAQSVAPLNRTDSESAPAPTDAALRVDARLNPVTHTQFFFVRHADGTSTARNATSLTFTSTDGRYSIPQQAGTAIAVDGRDAKIVVADYDMDGQHLVYSTAQLMTHAAVAGQDVAAFAARTGDAGETVLRYSGQPSVKVLAGNATSTFNSTNGDLCLDYTAGALTEVAVSGGGRPPLTLLLGDDAALARLWQVGTAGGPVLVLGPALTRTAALGGATLALTGDTDGATPAQVWAPSSVTGLTWNGTPVNATSGPSGQLSASLQGPASVTLPALTTWRYHAESPETQPGFDDSTWAVANHRKTSGPAPPTVPVLYADDYGFHHGDVWYRGHFTATGGETAVSLTGATGANGIYSAWLNGTYLGVSGTGGGHHSFAIPAGTLRRGAGNVISVLLRDMGHDEGGNKNPRGLTTASLTGASDTVTWRIQGNQGGETPADPVRGAMNSGGLFGERTGEDLPGFNDSGWQTVAVPHADPVPGVAWYRTSFSLALPADQDVPIALHLSTPVGEHDRVLIFLNGWNMGQYVSDLGPQTTFQLPPGVLHTAGANTLALAVWSPVAGAGGLGPVSLVQEGNVATSLRVRDVPAPG